MDSADGRLPDTPPAGLAGLLTHPAIWRGRSLVPIDTHATGYARLDDALPGRGWPVASLTEILTLRPGLGELRLLVPLIAAIARSQPPRWVSWISPPFEPYAPALVAEGVPVDRQLVIRTGHPLWALEQTLDSGACGVALAWFDARGPRVRPRDLRRLQLITQRHRAPAFLFRGLEAARETSPAGLRLLFEPRPGGARLQLLKSRGGRREPFELRWPTLHRDGPQHDGPQHDGPRRDGPHREAAHGRP
jgi:hypothetical protein